MTAANSNKQRVVGRPFQPGQSGNPTGRPKIIGAMRDLARSFTQDALETLALAMYEAPTWTERTAAANSLLDRAWGKPTQPIAGDDSMDALRIADGRATIVGRIDRLMAAAEIAATERDRATPDRDRMH